VGASEAEAKANTELHDQRTLAPSGASPQRPAKDPDADTPVQAAIRLAWEATSGTGAPGGKGYSGLVALVQEHGIPKVEAWVEWLRGQTEVEPPEGADCWKWFCTLFRRAMTRDFEWQREAEKHKNQRWLLTPDGRKLYERDWSPGDRATVDAWTTEGRWLPDLGISTLQEIVDGKPRFKGASE